MTAGDRWICQVCWKSNGEVFAPAPDLFNPIAIRWFSLLVLGGVGLAAGAGVVLMFVRRERPNGAEARAGQSPDGV